MDGKVKILHPIIQRMEINFCLTPRDTGEFISSKNNSHCKKSYYRWRFPHELPYGIDKGYRNHGIIDSLSHR